MPYKQAFKTAWENFEVIADITTGIIVPYAHNDIAGRLCALERGEKDYGKKLRLLLSEAGQYSVNVFSNQLKRLMAENMIYEILPESGIYALNDGFYDDEFGLSYELCNFDSSPLFAWNGTGIFMVGMKYWLLVAVMRELKLSKVEIGNREIAM